MEIVPTQAGPAASGARAADAARAGARASESAAAGATAAADFQTFLTLLTSQLRNQDPLKPLESTEFVAQLASFSAVEQQIRGNDRLDRIIEALSGGPAAGLAQWIGREVRAPVAANFQGMPVDVEVEPDSQADKAFLVVRNAFDQVVARQPVDPALANARWDGTGVGGEPQPHGAYGFALESYRGEELLSTTPGLVFAPVTEVRLVDGRAELVLESGERTPVEAVTAVR
jgi:flagellar basal-body rod modification protein FlgD